MRISRKFQVKFTLVFRRKVLGGGWILTTPTWWDTYLQRWCPKSGDLILVIKRTKNSLSQNEIEGPTSRHSSRIE